MDLEFQELDHEEERPLRKTGRPQNSRNTKRRKPKRGKQVTVILLRSGLCLLTAVVLLVVTALTAVLIVHYGPSAAARDRFVLTVTETSAAGFLATWFLPKSTVDAIIKSNEVVVPDDTTNPDIIKPPDPDDPDDPEFDINGVEIIDIVGKTYKGKLMIVNNPKRVSIGTPEAYGEDKRGVTTIDMVRLSNSLGGINGGGFYDTGKGNGGIPTGRSNSPGVVISKGKLMWGNKNSTYEIIGLNQDGILILGKMTAQEALDQGIVEALNFGPYLVLNGTPCVVEGIGEMALNPRSAIGQRKDGAILLLAIEGRHPTRMGASYEDVIEIMMEYGAVNAANLDGGSSTYMVYENEIITQLASFYGPRRMATSILVSRVEE